MPILPCLHLCVLDNQHSNKDQSVLPTNCISRVFPCHLSNLKTKICLICVGDSCQFQIRFRLGCESVSPEMEVDRDIVQEFKQLNRGDLDFNKKCAQLTQEITTGQLTIVQLVEQLGSLLVDVSATNRELGTWILTQVLEELPPNHFDALQLNFICTFYTDRLKDHHQVIPAVLRGILALTRFEQFPDGAATQILSALFQHVSCQQQVQQDRLHIYKIFQVFLQRRTTELCTMGLDFVYGVISAVDGERDPKNLIFLFNWFSTFLKTVKLGHLSEECFEIMACYFPVDFKAPPQDPNAITRDKLAEALTPCLTALPEFAEFCFPLALEKLDSSLEVAKLDSLQLLKVGCSCFDAAAYVPHSTEIWSQIQKELFNNPNPDLELACLSTLTSVIGRISQDSRVNSTVKDISDTVKRNLIPDSKLFEPSWKLLLSVAKGSRISSDLITKDIIPILINTFNITHTPLRKVAVLKVLIKFFDSYVTLHDHVEFKELNEVPILCLKGAMGENDDLKVTGFEGLTQIAPFLDMDVRFSMYESFQRLLLIPQSERVRLAVIKCFVEMSRNFSSEVKDKVTKSIKIDQRPMLELYLEALCAIAPQDYFTNYVIDLFLDCLNRDPSLGQVAINAFKNLLELHENNDKIPRTLLEKNVIETLVDWCFKNTTVERQCLQNVSFVLKTIIGNQTSNRQRDIIDKHLPKIVDLSKPHQLLLLDGLLCNLWRDVQIDYNILDDLTKLALKNDDYIQSVAVQLLANLINKCNDEMTLDTYLNHFEEHMNNTTVLAWLTKALVMRNHQRACSWTLKLIELLKNDASVAKAFRIVINDNCEFLSGKSHCLKTVLYQQKFFVLVSTKLNEIYHPELNSCLVALGYLLEHTPKQAILLQFNKILKLFILCLEKCDEVEILTVLLDIVRDFIVQKEQCIEDHFAEFLKYLLKLSTFDKSMKVRILALKCLEEYPSSFPVYKLLPHKTEVLKVLGEVTDDKKRIVRREAVEARCLWFLFDAPM